MEPPVPLWLVAGGRQLVAVLAILSGAASGLAECPAGEEIRATLAGLQLERAARTEEFGLEPLDALYEKALKTPGKPVLERNGKLAQAVLLTTYPIESLWMAINDEDHYAGGDYLPVRHSEVIEGVPRGERRLLFQYFKRSGVGRWWIDEVVMSRGLYQESDGMLWELQWWDLMETRGEEDLPAEFSDLGLAPIRESRGAWLMIPFGDSCTLVEYVTVSNPGGFLNLAQWFAAGHVIRETLEGIQRLASDHIPQPHPEARFIRPDGSAIDASEPQQ